MLCIRQIGVTHRHIAQNYEKHRAASVGRQAAVIGAGILGGGAAASAANLATGVGGYPLAPGEAMSFAVANASALYFIANAASVVYFGGN